MKIDFDGMTPTTARFLDAELRALELVHGLSSLEEKLEPESERAAIHKALAVSIGQLRAGLTDILPSPDKEVPFDDFRKLVSGFFSALGKFYGAPSASPPADDLNQIG